MCEQKLYKVLKEMRRIFLEKDKRKEKRGEEGNGVERTWR
jgi:hypothetical protein